jgi:uncharacterized membrane protein
MCRLIVRPQLRHGGSALPRTAWDKSKMSPTFGFVGKDRADMWTICNEFNELTWVAIGSFNEDACGPVDPAAPWMISGWYAIEPGTCGNVLDANLAEIGPFFLYYAESASGSWPGSVSIPIPQEEFERCLGTTAPGDVSRSFAVINVGNNEDFILRLTA